MRKLILIVIMFISPTLVAPTIPVEDVEIIKTEPTISEHDQFLNDIGFRATINKRSGGYYIIRLSKYSYKDFLH